MPQDWERRRILEIGFIAVAVAALAVRVATTAEPLGIDQSLWASAVRGMSRGQLLYRDVWEQRPPGIYLTYWFAFRILGWDPGTVAWLDLGAATVVTGCLWRIGARVDRPITGALAAALYAVLTVPAWLYKTGSGAGFLERSVCETFIAAAVSVAAWFAARYVISGGWISLAGLGVFAGSAIVFKPNAALYLPALGMWALIARRRTGKPIPAFRALTIIAAAASVVPVAVLIWLWRDQLLADGRVAVVDFNRFYLAQGFTLAGYLRDFADRIGLRVKTDPLWTSGALATFVALADFARRRPLAAVAWLSIAWGAAAAGVIAVNGARLFNTYFVQAFPPLALLTAWLLSQAFVNRGMRRWLAIGTAVLVGAMLVRRDYPGKVWDVTHADLDMLRGRVARPDYLLRFGGYGTGRGYSARAVEELASFVHERTTPEESVFLFGISGAGVYFLADRLPAQRFLRVNDFVPELFPNPGFTLSAVVTTLERRRPRYLIFERNVSASDPVMNRAVERLPEEPAVAALLESYDQETRIEDFTLYRRRDGVQPARSSQRTTAVPTVDSRDPRR